MTPATIALFVTLALAFPALLVAIALRRVKLRREIDSAGRDAKLRIVRLVRGRTYEDVVIIQCDAEVSLPGEPPYSVSPQLTLPVFAVNELKPGVELKARVHPRNRSKLGVFLPDGRRISSV